MDCRYISGASWVLGAIALASITPLLAERILNIPAGLLKEAKTTFYLLALAIPIILISSSFSGILEAGQRFDLVNYIKVPQARELSYSFDCFGIGTRATRCRYPYSDGEAHWFNNFYSYRFSLFSNNKEVFNTIFIFRQLFAFGGWVTVSNIVSPILSNFDRFLIGSLLSMAAVTYYTAPYEAVTKLWIIPMSLTMTLFPAFSSMNGSKALNRVVFLRVQLNMCL